MNGFLYVQTEYSFLTSQNKINELVLKAKELGYESINITDNNMHGAYKFYKECKNQNIKPIIGLKINVRSNTRIETKLLAYAINNEGYKALIKIASHQAIKGIVELDYLSKLSNNLCIVTPGIEGDIEQYVVDNLMNEANKLVDEYNKLFKNFYIGISLNNDILRDYASVLYDIALSKNITCLPVNRCLYLNKEDYEYYKYFRAIDDLKITELDGFYHLLDKNELSNLYQGFLDLEDNYNEFINKINVDISRVSKTLPIFPNNKGLTSKELLYKLCHLGLKKRGCYNEIYVNRLNYELDIISKMGYDDYFLIVYDFIYFSKKNDILVGPGRGSAAGSLVSFCLGITNIDPIKYDLLFERFLNPERISMPDIDIDFPNDKRELVIEYVKNKYGILHVCHIATFQRFKSRMAIRDIGRVLNVDKQIINVIIDKFKDDSNILEFMENNPNLLTNNVAKKLLTIASKVEGLPRQVGTHAAGIIISHDELIESVAISNGINGVYQSQFEAIDLEELGLLKIDFLGLINLSTIKSIIDNARIDLSKIPLNDYKTFKLLSSADTSGIFQLESAGIRNVLKKLKPNSLSDIVATLALYRPGPMDQIDEFIARKNGKSFSYVNPLLEPILKPTYGIIVYQEQIMQISNVFAGYSLGEADVLRRAVSKKKLDVLELERKNFIEKSLKMNRSIEEANEIYDYIVKFANYGFNKSHSVAYALISYQMAYLKANYYKYFMLELLNDNISVTSKLMDYINECLNKNIKVLKPNINISDSKFIIYNNDIYYPLIGIKGFGVNNVNKIIEERNKGLFKSFSDFKSRIQLSTQMLDMLIFSGAFDMFGEKHILKNQSDSDFELMNKFVDDIIVNVKKFPNSYLFEKEYEALGLNIEYHMFDDYKDIMKKYNLRLLKDIKDNVSDVICLVTNVKEIKTKSNELMAFLSITDEFVKYELVMFPNCYKQLKKDLKRGIILKVRVKIEKNDEKISLIAMNAQIIGE